MTNKKSKKDITKKPHQLLIEATERWKSSIQEANRSWAIAVEKIDGIYVKECEKIESGSVTLRHTDMKSLQHIDLFSGIGGFAYAIDQVWDNVEHTFIEIDPFCQQILKKRFKGSKIYGDIRTFTNTNRAGSGTSTSGTNGNRQEKNEGRIEQSQPKSGRQDSTSSNTKLQSIQKEVERTRGVGFREGDKIRQVNRTSSRTVDILTGGFPCQPFSQAGQRRGKEDDRYLWPEMLRIIKEFNPTWIVGENVAGITNMAQQQSEIEVEGEADNDEENDQSGDADGIFYEIITSLESLNYSVQTFVIPACAVNAPHRRDRVWIVAHSNSQRWGKCEGLSEEGRNHRELSKSAIESGVSINQDTISKRSRGGMEDNRQILGSRCTEIENERPDWQRNWLEVATELCGVDDGLSTELDGFKLSKAGHRVERLKALGNSIVPQVVIEIFKGIKQVNLL